MPPDPASSLLSFAPKLRGLFPVLCGFFCFFFDFLGFFWYESVCPNSDSTQALVPCSKEGHLSHPNWTGSSERRSVATGCCSAGMRGGKMPRPQAFSQVQVVWILEFSSLKGFEPVFSTCARVWDRNPKTGASRSPNDLATPDPKASSRSRGDDSAPCSKAEAARQEQEGQLRTVSPRLPLPWGSRTGQQLEGR